MKKIATALCALMLAGCAATGDQFSGFARPQKGNGSVYVYRPDAFFGSARSFVIKADDEIIGILRNGGYLHKELPVGTHFITSTTELTRTEKINIQESQPTCISFSVGAGSIGPVPLLKPIDTETCLFEIKKTKLSN